MENRWILVVVTVVVSISSMVLVREEGNWGNWAAVECMRVIGAGFSLIGLTPPGFFAYVPAFFALLWFYPFALRLGWLRGAIWTVLIGVGVAVDSWLPGVVYGAGEVILLFPCLAMIGRRTRPWMAIPACGALTIVLILYPKEGGLFDKEWTWLNMYAAWAIGSVAYAGILIFGTKLIPKKP